MPQIRLSSLPALLVGILALPCLRSDAAVVAPTLGVARMTPPFFRFTWTNASSAFVLETVDSLGRAWKPVPVTPAVVDGVSSVIVLAGDDHRWFRLRADRSVTSVAGTSPEVGEDGVAVTRETVVRLDGPLSPRAAIGPNTLFAGVSGRRLLSRAEISADRQSLTLFFLENLPANARVNVAFDGTNLPDEAGQDLDVDGDGEPGGLWSFSFNTLGIVGLPNTGVIGHVYASEKLPDGSNQPLVNAIVTVDGAEETLRTLTDTNGFFRLQPAPAGRFFVHVDGRTAEGSRWPGGAYYPYVGKAWEARVGDTNNPAGGTGEIFLPLVQADALVSLSNTDATKVTFAPSLLATNPALAGVEVNVPANALVNANGARGGRVGIAPVAPDRLPEKLPPGLNFPLVITVQTDGPQNFDQPVPVKFPNLPDPRTGKKLPPGAKTALWSFNHDTGRWEIQGSMTISADGLFAVSDPGVGVRQPGWHGANPGSTGGGPDPIRYPDDDDNKCDGLWDCDNDGCFEAHVECPRKNCDDYLKEIKRLEQYCSISDRIRDKLDEAICGFLVGCPDPAWRAKWDQCRAAIQKAQDDYYQCLRSQTAVARGQAAPAAPVETDPRLALQRALTAAAATQLERLLGSIEWTRVEPAEFSAYADLLQAIAAGRAAGSPAGIQLDASERAGVLALPLPSNLTTAMVVTAMSRLNAHAANTLPAGDRAQIEAAGAAYQAQWAEAQALGWRSTYDGYFQIEVEQSRKVLPDTTLSFARQRRLFFLITEIETGFEIRGRLNAAGRFDNLILAPDTLYEVRYLDPLTGAVGRAMFRSASAGATTLIPAAPMTVPTELADTDGDGLADDWERVPLTRFDRADTDGDGVNDREELRANTDPIDGTPLALGVVNEVGMTWSPVHVAVGGDMAVVGGALGGVGIFNVRNPLKPSLVAELNSSGGMAFAVAAEGSRAAYTDEEHVLRIVDLQAPGGPVQGLALPLTGASPVALRAGRVFVSRNAGPLEAHIQMLDPVYGDVIAEATSPVGGAVQELVAHGEWLFSIQQTTIGIYQISPDALTLRGSHVLTSDSAAPLENSIRLFATDAHLYAGAFAGYRVIDLANPAAPVLLGKAATTQAAIHSLAHNGSGLLLPVTSFGGEASLRVSVYDASRPDVTTNLLSSWDTPGNVRGIALHRGYALVTDATVGLATVNYLAPDRGTNPPTISLRVQVLHPPDAHESAREFGVTAATTDDVQVREVEFLVDDVVQQIDGSYPFETTLRAPVYSANKTNFTVRARAVDTAGNATLSAPLVVRLSPDVSRPRLISTSPADGSTWLPGELTGVTATFNEPMQPGSLAAQFQVRNAGPDGAVGTPDDQLVAASLVYPFGTNETARLAFNSPLPVGKYRVTLAPALVDRFNNPLLAGREWAFEVRGPMIFASPSAVAWQVPANWNPPRLPNTNDAVVVPAGNADRVILSGGSLFASRLSLQSALWLGPTNLSSSSANTLTVRNLAELNAPLTVAGTSQLLGPGTYYNTSLLRFVGAGSSLLAGVTVLNAGTLRVDKVNSGGLQMGANTRIVNQPGALIEIAGPSDIGTSGSRNSSVLENAGRLRKIGAPPAKLTTDRFVHTGSLEVQEGDLELNLGDGTQLGGSILVAPGSRLLVRTSLSGGAVPLVLPNGRLAGGGTLRFLSGLPVRGEVDLDGTLETVTSMRFNGRVRVGGRYTAEQGEATFTSPFNEFTGNVTALSSIVFNSPAEVRLRDLAVGANGRLTANSPVLVQGSLSTSNNATINGSRRVTVLGPANFAGILSGNTVALEIGGRSQFAPGAAFRFSDGRLISLPGSEVHLEGLADFTAGEIQANGRVLHDGPGAVRLAAPRGTTGLTGTGRLEVVRGTVDLAMGGVFQGQLKVGANGNFRLAGTGFVLETNSTVVCDGEFMSLEQPNTQVGSVNIVRGAFQAARVRIHRRELQFDADYTLPLVIVDKAGEFGGRGTVSIQQLVLGDSAWFKGTGVTRLLGNTTWSNYVVMEDTRTIENLGTITVQDAGRLVVSDQPQFRNLPGATINFRNDRDFLNDRKATLENQGTIVKSAGTDTTLIRARLLNSGTIEIRTGRVQLDINERLQNSAGQIWLNGGGLVGSVYMSGGRFRGQTPLDDPMRGLELGGAAEVEIEASGSRFGRLELSGANAYRQSSLGILHLDVGGAGTSGVDFDLLVAGASPTFNGRLNVRLANGFVPALGQKIRVIQWTGNRSGQFATVTGENLPAGRKWKVNYEAAAATVELVAE